MMEDARVCRYLHSKASFGAEDFQNKQQPGISTAAASNSGSSTPAKNDELRLHGHEV